MMGVPVGPSRRSPSRLAAAFVGAACLVNLLAGCPKIFGDRDNPVDPDSPTYQGYPSVKSSADIRAVLPPDGGTLVGVTLTIAKVEGATAYRFALAASAASLGQNPLYDDDGHATNVIDIDGAPLADAATYYWRARSRDANGNWGAWGAVFSFSTKFEAAEPPACSPSGGPFATSPTVAMNSMTPHAKIYYTVDGSAPTAASSLYSSPVLIAIEPATVIKAVAVATGFLPSTVTTGTYRVYAAGDPGPAGGLVFYDAGSYTAGWRFMEAAPIDQGTGVAWYDGAYPTTGATGTAVGTGAENTASIVAAQGAGSYAAKLCADLVLGGYDDWFLPSKDELHQIYVNLKSPGLGDLGGARYWSSSEYSGTEAWYNNLGGDYELHNDKNYQNRVRAARRF